MTSAFFFDVAKAFDKIYHNDLIYKLFPLKAPGKVIYILWTLSNLIKQKLKDTIEHLLPRVPQYIDQLLLYTHHQLKDA